MAGKIKPSAGIGMVADNGCLSVNGEEFNTDERKREGKTTRFVIRTLTWKVLSRTNRASGGVEHRERYSGEPAVDGKAQRSRGRDRNVDDAPAL
jgi:hypothetical protein